MPHALNFVAGWWLILGAFVSGAVIGLGFHREEYLGGYGSFRRRLLRLGHVALAALGLINVAYGVSPTGHAGATEGWAAPLLLAGAIAMPVVCFLAAWRQGFRHLFFIPVTLLTGAVALIIYGAGDSQPVRDQSGQRGAPSASKACRASVLQTPVRTSASARQTPYDEIHP